MAQFQTKLEEQDRQLRRRNKKIRELKAELEEANKKRSTTVDILQTLEEQTRIKQLERQVQDLTMISALDNVWKAKAAELEAKLEATEREKQQAEAALKEKLQQAKAAAAAAVTAPKDADVLASPTPSLLLSPCPLSDKVLQLKADRAARENTLRMQLRETEIALLDEKDAIQAVGATADNNNHTSTSEHSSSSASSSATDQLTQPKDEKDKVDDETLLRIQHHDTQLSALQTQMGDLLQHAQDRITQLKSHLKAAETKQPYSSRRTNGRTPLLDGIFECDDRDMQEGPFTPSSHSIPESDTLQQSIGGKDAVHLTKPRKRLSVLERENEALEKANRELLKQLQAVREVSTYASQETTTSQDVHLPETTGTPVHCDPALDDCKDLVVEATLVDPTTADGRKIVNRRLLSFLRGGIPNRPGQ